MAAAAAKARDLGRDTDQDHATVPTARRISVPEDVEVLILLASLALFIIQGWTLAVRVAIVAWIVYIVKLVRTLSEACARRVVNITPAIAVHVYFCICLITAAAASVDEFRLLYICFALLTGAVSAVLMLMCCMAEGG